MNDNEKQAIEEMAKYLFEFAPILSESNCHYVAERAYNDGYRKQSEGEWKGNGYLKNCSECRNVVNFNNVSIWLYNFCPYCGAKMKGGE